MGQFSRYRSSGCFALFLSFWLQVGDSRISLLGGSSMGDGEIDIGCGVGAYKVRRSLLSKTNLKQPI